ncbi:hypothetical protein [Nocardia sp. NPDC004860]|uniref:hypothetical protein n=1 Tax=Nocardia sp. NPDC004860 TaxID=3154557 RepID=UPI00339F118E
MGQDVKYFHTAGVSPGLFVQNGQNPNIGHRVRARGIGATRIATNREAGHAVFNALLAMTGADEAGSPRARSNMATIQLTQ